MTRVVALAALTMAVLAVTASATTPSTQIIVTRDAAQLPSGCTAQGVASLLGTFFDAFNRADWQEVDTLFAPAGSEPPYFALFSFDRNVVIYERDRLISYLVNLRSQGERFRLLSVQVKPGGSGVSSSVGIEVRIELAAGFGGGKGMIECRSQRIWQGAMGAQPSVPLALPCPQPSGWSPSGPVVACTSGPNARALSPTFRVSSTRVNLPPRCKPERVRTTVRRALSDFNQGLGEDFATYFVRGGRFHPYTRSITGAGFVRRRAITRYVAIRYHAGDGWTVGHLFTPQTSVGLPGQAVYAVDLRVSHQGAPIAEHIGAKLAVDCSSGLLKAWVGPAIKTPPR